VFKSIWSSLATINGKLVVDGSEALLSRTAEKEKTEKTKKRPREDSPTPPPVVSFNLIQDLVSNFHNTGIVQMCQFALAWFVLLCSEMSQWWKTL